MVAGLVPYVPGEQPKLANLTKLNTNENPYPPSPKVVAAIQAAAQQGLQLYPDPESVALRTEIARQYGLQMDQVFVGNSSDEVLAHAFFALFQQGAPLVLPDVTYSFYQVYCGLYGIPMHVVPLADGLRVDVEALTAPELAGVVIANPNAPTGIGLPLAQIERLLQMHPQHAVLVDEAYVDFGGTSAVGLINRYPNLLVTQTLSKSRSLAGLRVGLACGQRPLIEALERVKNSFNSYPWAVWRRPVHWPLLKTRPTLPRPVPLWSTAAKAWCCSWKTWASRCCRHRPTLCLPAIRSMTRRSWRPSCGRGRCWCATSSRLASISTCASAWARLRSATRC